MLAWGQELEVGDGRDGRDRLGAKRSLGALRNFEAAQLGALLASSPAHAGLPLKSFGSGGFKEYTVGNAYQAWEVPPIYHSNHPLVIRFANAGVHA